MELSAIPIWGQYGLVGLSLSLNIFFIVQFLRGEIVTRKELDQVQRMSDTWQKGWEVSQQNQSLWSELASRFGVVADTMEHLLTSLPPIAKKKDGEDSNVDP